MRIGYVNPEYGARRNIIGCCSECDYIRVRSFKSAFEKIKAKVGLSTLGLSPYYFCGGFARLIYITFGTMSRYGLAKRLI